jgi:hypothetical protein
MALSDLQLAERNPRFSEVLVQLQLDGKGVMDLKVDGMEPKV